MNYDEIVEGCKKDKREAQMKFYALFSREVYVTAYRLLENSFDAEEVMQESLLKVLMNTDLLLPQRSNMLMRIKRIAINASVDVLRRRSNTVLWNDSIDAEEDENFEDVLMREERISLLHKAIEALPTGYRTVVLMYIVEELDYKEISQILNVTASAVRSQLTRAKRRITEWFENYENGR